MAADMKFSCGHALKFEPTGDTAFLPNEIGHQKTPEIVSAYNDLFFNVYPAFHPKRMLEIGIWHGGSLAVWRDLFDSTVILGIDNVNRLSETAKAHLAEDPRVIPQWLDVREQGLSQLGSFDLVIDDGEHGPPWVFPAFEVLWPKVMPGGLYVIEDWKNDSLQPHEMMKHLSDKVRGLRWQDDDAGPLAPLKLIVYRGFIVLEKKK